MSIFHPFRKKEEKEKIPAIERPAVSPVATPAVAITPRVGRHTISWSVLRQPLVSEKAAHVGIYNQYVFVVAPSATKVDVRRSVYEAYGVRPVRVNMVRVRGRSVRYGRSAGKTKAWKKAIVTLPKGKTIQVYEGV